MVHRVEHFEGLISYKFVIAIDKKGNLVIFAYLSESPVQIRYSSHLFLISFKQNFLSLFSCNFIAIEIALNVFAGQIWGSIVDDDYVVILVILVEN